MSATTGEIETWDDWTPVNKAAALIDCSGPLIRNFVNGAHKERPVLPSRNIAGQGRCVIPRQAYEWIVKYCPRRPKRLKSPPEAVSGDQTPETFTTTTTGELIVDPEILRALNGADPLTFTPQDLALRLTLAGVDGVKVKPLIQAVNSLQRKHEADTRAGRNIAPEDVVKMLRSHGEIIAELTDERGPIIAAELLNLVRSEFGIDLMAKSCIAKARFEQFFNDRFGHALICAIRKLVEDQVRGVMPLELS